MSRRSGTCLRCCLVIFAVISALGVCGPALYWRFKKSFGFSVPKASSCPPCTCDCPPPLSLLKIAPGISLSSCIWPVLVTPILFLHLGLLSIFNFDPVFGNLEGIEVYPFHQFEVLTRFYYDSGSQALFLLSLFINFLFARLKFSEYISRFINPEF
uniref:Uncharacterized protein n=1 Tax=Rhizophora mucronata TaxID=61149 RepID=A0A2P2IH47_RHIMU